jgi:hypothetical protein
MKTTENENLLTKIGRSMKVTEKGKFVWVSIILPIIVAAATAIVTNISTFSIYERQVKKELEPVLFRVKSIIKNNGNILPVTVIYGAPVIQHVVYRQAYNEKTIREDKVTLHEKGDTVTFNFPQFLIDKKLKAKMMEEIDFLTKNNDADETLYFLVEDLADFLQQYTIPEVNTTNELVNTKWCNEKVLDQWNNHIVMLQRWYNRKNK